jgi:hypothetical protein
MDFDFAFGFFSYLFEWSRFGRFGDASTGAAPSANNATSAPIGG